MSRRTKAAIAMAGLAVASAQAPPIPEAKPVGTSNMCIVGPEWEYAPRWQIEGPGMMKPNLTPEECAAVCEEMGYCMGASFIDWDDGSTRCFLKAFEPPPAPAAYPCWKGLLEGKSPYALVMKNGATCADMTYVAGDPPVCKEEAKDYPAYGDSAPWVGKTAATAPAAAPTTGPEAMSPTGPEATVVDPAAPPEPMLAGPTAAPTEAPVAAGPAPAPTEIKTTNGTYMAYKERDYIPKAGDVTAVMVEDVGAGVVVDSDMACAAECDTRIGCNAASYYGQVEADWPGSKNCWPKMLGDTCSLPSDAIADPKATLILSSAECAPGAATTTASAPTGAPPAASGPSGTESGTTTATRGGDVSSDGAEVEPSGAQSLASAGAAIVAGAMLLL